MLLWVAGAPGTMTNQDRATSLESACFGGHLVLLPEGRRPPSLLRSVQPGSRAGNPPAGWRRRLSDGKHPLPARQICLSIGAPSAASVAKNSQRRPTRPRPPADAADITILYIAEKMRRAWERRNGEEERHSSRGRPDDDDAGRSPLMASCHITPYPG